MSTFRWIAASVLTIALTIGYSASGSDVKSRKAINIGLLTGAFLMAIELSIALIGGHDIVDALLLRTSTGYGLALGYALITAGVVTATINALRAMRSATTDARAKDRQ